MTTAAPQPTPRPRGSERRRSTGGGTLGVRTIPNDPVDVRMLARAFIGVTLARRYPTREDANTALASYPSRHSPTARRPGLST